MSARNGRKNISSVIFSVTGVIIIAKLLGFVKQMVASGAFGATLDTDIINIAQTVIGDVEYVLAHVLMTSFISVYLNAAEEGGERVARFAKNAMRAFLVIAVAVAAVLTAAAFPLARLLAPSYDAAASSRLAAYLRVYSPLVILFVVTAVNQGLLNANRRFVAVEARSIPQSLIMIAVIAVVGRAIGADALVVGFLIYTVFNTVWFWMLSRKYRAGASADKFTQVFRDPLVRRLLGMSAPLLVGYSAYYINQQINKSLASGLGEGAVTELSYGAVLFNLVTAFIASFASIMFSYVTSAIAGGEHDRAAELANRTAALLAAVFLPVTLVCLTLAPEISRIAFGRGVFSDKNVAATASALAGYSFSFLPLVLQEVYGRVQYGYGDARRPMINSIVSIVCNVVFSVLFSRYYGIAGITFACSLATFVYGVLNFITARKHNRAVSLRPLALCAPFMALGGCACFFVIRAIAARLAERGAFLRFCAAAACGIAVYAVIMLPVALLALKKKNKAQPAANGGDDRQTD